MTQFTAENEALCEEIADKLYNRFNRFGMPEQCTLAALTDLYQIPAELEEVCKTLLDGVQFGLVLAATQPDTAGGLLEFIATSKPNDLQIQAFAKITAILYAKLQENTTMRDLR